MSETPTATPERRIALVIGNADYTHLRKLHGPPADVGEMVRVLRDNLQFEVIRVEDCDFPVFRKVRKDFLDRLLGAAVGVLYFSGHGISDSEGASFLLPVDARIEEPEDRWRTGFSVRELITDMQSKTEISLLFLDACRDDPFAAQTGQRTKSAEPARSGFVAVDQSQLNQVLVAYATSEGKTVPDSKRGELSAFTKALAEHLPAKDQSLLEILVQVQEQVRLETKGAQQPWTKQALGKNVYLGRPCAQESTNEVAPVARAQESTKEVAPVARTQGPTKEVAPLSAYKALAATGVALMLAWLFWWAMTGPALPEAKLLLRVNISGAELFIDDTPMGKTTRNLMVIPLSPGTHTVRIEKPGHRSWSREEDFLGGREKHLEAELLFERSATPSPSSLSSDPTGESK